jgi:hypothetical protein
MTSAIIIGAYQTIAQYSTAIGPHTAAIGSVGSTGFRPIPCACGYRFEKNEKYCPSCERHPGYCIPSKLDCIYCKLKYKLQNIRIEQNRINNALNKIFGSDVQNLLLFLNNRINSKYLIIEILEGYSWAEEFTSYRLLQLVK